MTRGEIRTLIWDWLDDPLGGYFSATRVNAWINNGQREVQKQLIQAGQMYYQKCAETDSVANQRDYVLPDDFLKIDRIEFVISGTGVNENKVLLTPITLNQQDLIGPFTGQPQVYDVKKDRFSLYPIPDSNSAPKVIRLYYEYRITDMTSDSDIPDVPEDYHEYIALIAAFNGYIKDDRIPNNLIEKHNEYKTLLKQMAQQRDESAPRMVVVTEGDGFGTLF